MSYNVVKETEDDPFVIAKFYFCAYLSSFVKPFLIKYQINKPILPSMYFSLKDLI